jgi:hypothetical protein
MFELSIWKVKDVVLFFNEQIEEGSDVVLTEAFSLENVYQLTV